MHMETIEEEPAGLKSRLHELEDELHKEKRLRDKIERFCNENHCGKHDGSLPNDSLTWQMYRKREKEVAKLRTNIEIAMSSHEEAMALAKLQFTQELDQLQQEISSLRATEPESGAPREGGSVSTIEETFITRKLEIELEELRKERINLEYEVKRLRVRLSEETKAKDMFEEQLKDATLQLDELHKQLDDEEHSRNELKRSLKAAADELEQWKSHYAAGMQKGDTEDGDVVSRRRLSIKMQEIDEAIQKAESASLTMAKVKTQDITTKDEDLVLVSVDRGRRGKAADFTLEQELQEFKIKFADSEQQLCIWKKKYEELGYLKDGLEEQIEVKKSQIKSWQDTCEEMKQKMIEMEKIKEDKFVLEDRIHEMTASVQRTEALKQELEDMRLQFADEREQLKTELAEQENHISTLESSRSSLNLNVDELQRKISDLESQVDDLTAENNKLNYNLEATKSSFDLQGQGKSALEQKVHNLNARLVEIQGKYVNEQQEKQELRRIFRESTVGIVQLKTKIECERIKCPDDYHELKQSLISRLEMTEEIFTEAQARARRELAVNQRARRASVGLVPLPPAIPDKEEYEVLEWKEKYDEICREIEKAEDEVKVMATQVSRLQCVADETSEDLHNVAEEKKTVNETLESTTKELDEIKEEVTNLKEYNQGLNEEVVKLNSTIKEMEAAFEEDNNAKLTEISDLRTANEDLKDALEIVSKQADDSKDEIQERVSKAKEIMDENETLKLAKEDLLKANRELEWKVKSQNIALDEETKSHQETDAELLAAEKKVKELSRALDELREKEADSKKLNETEQKLKEMKNKIKEEKERSDEAEEELNKLKKKLKDVKSNMEESLSAKDEEIEDLKRSKKDALKQVKEIELSMKEEVTFKELAEEEARTIEKKLREATLKIEELEKPDKYGADALASNKDLNKNIKALQAELDQEIAAHDETKEELINLQNKTRGIKTVDDSELERQVKEMKSILEAEQAAHKDTNEELANVRKKLKEVKKDLEEEKAGIARSKANKLQKNVEEFKTALQEEKQDHENTNQLLESIQKELNNANKKISRLRNEIDSEKESEQTLESMQKRVKELQKMLENEQNDHERTENELEEAQNQLKAANRKITDLQREIEEAGSNADKELKNESRGFKKRIRELEESMAEEQADHEKTKNVMSTLQQEIQEANEKITELEEGQKIGDKSASRESKAFERRIKQLEEELEEEKADHDSTNEKLVKMQQRLNEANEMISDIKQNGDSSSRNEKESRKKISVLEIKLKELEEENREIKEKLEDGQADSKENFRSELKDIQITLEEERSKVSDLTTKLSRAERRLNTSKEELEDLKASQNLDDEDEQREIIKLQKKIENLHVALEEEMSAHEETDRELGRLEGQLEAANDELRELKANKSNEEPSNVKSTAKIQLKVKQLESELEEERASNKETMENFSELKQRCRSMSIELENLKSQRSQDSEDGSQTSELHIMIQKLEATLEDEKAAHEETFDDLKQVQKKLKTVKIQLQAARAENEQNDAEPGTFKSEMKIQIKNLQNALDDQIESQEETSKAIVDLKKRHRTEIKIARAQRGRASISISRPGPDGNEEEEVVDMQEHLEGQISDLQKKYDKAVVQLEIHIADNNKMQDELEDAHVRVQASLKDIQDLKEAKKEIERENKDLKDTVKDLEDEVDELRSAERDTLSVQRRRMSKRNIEAEGVGRSDLLKENEELQRTIAELENEIEEMRTKVRRAAKSHDSDDDDYKVKELKSKLSEALFQLEAVEETLHSEEKFRSELKVSLKDTMKDLETMRNEHEDAGGEGPQSGKLIKAQRRFANRMSDLEDGITESQTKIKTIDKYQLKIAELNKEIRLYLDQDGGSHGMSAYVWKSKYDTLLIQYERIEKELSASKLELQSMTKVNEDVTMEMQQCRHDNRLLQERIDELLKEISELKKEIAELEGAKRKLEREVSELTTAVEELQYTLDDERVRAESKIAELTQIRLDFQKEIAEKNEHIERITKSYEREIRDLKADLELERQAGIDYARHKSRMSDLLAQLQAQVEMLSESNSEFAKNNKKLQIKLKETQALLEDEKLTHQHTYDALSRCEKRVRDCFKQIDALQSNLERAERIKKRVVGEAEESQYKLDHIETKTVDLETVRLKNEIEIEHLQAELEDMEAKAQNAEEKARNALAELNEVKGTLRKYMDLEGEARKARELAERELRETQIRLAGLEDVDVKQLKLQIKNLQRQNAELEEDLASVLHQTKGFQRFEEKYERIVSNLELDLEEWKRAAEIAQSQNEALQIKMKKMRSQLESAESQAMVITSKYKNAQVDVEDATERADAAVKALMLKTRGLDFVEGRLTTEHYSVKGEEIVSFEDI